ncbi:MAG: M48 family metalloprotease [Aquificaceae bacterium]
MKAIFVLLVLSFCYGFFSIVSQEQEIQIGKRELPVVMSSLGGPFPDERVQMYVREVGMNLAKNTPRKLPYEFYVANSTKVNAFALPGGPIVITRGLLANLKTESELAAVIAHELGHINARHHAKFLERQIGINVAIGIGSIVAGDSKIGQIAIQAGQIGAQLLTLKYSREQEIEADRLAIDYMRASNYDPNGLIRVFETLKSMERYSPPEWLSTHPLTQNRIRVATQYMNQQPLSGQLISDSEEFQRIRSIILRSLGGRF